MTPEMPEDNVLYYGDNLDILRRYVENESVDLVYLDPPFNSNRDYNVLFQEQDGSRSAAQIKAFNDTWKWDQSSARTFYDIVQAGGPVADAMVALERLVGHNDVLAYLSMMAPRLVDLRRTLKPTGTLYLHCDPTGSHYLKVLLDAIFGPERFLNEITWKRSSAHSDTKQGMRRCGRIRDILLVFTKTDAYTWNPVYTRYTDDYLRSKYRHTTSKGRFYKETDLTGARPGGETEYEWPVKRADRKGVRWEADLDEEYETPKQGWEYRKVTPYSGRYWAYSKENLRTFAREGKLIHRSTGMPRLVQYADEMPGVPLQDLWDDITPEMGALDLGYPTQKPEALLERIIKSSSNEGNTVLDPFCGCGTTVAVAQRLNRRWIGIDITHLAITLLKHRLKSAYGDSVSYRVIGEPVSPPDAEVLAAQDPYQFQWWALGLVGARPVEQKKGADKGIDGRIYFFPDRTMKGKPEQMIFSVKAGNVTVSHMRDLRGVVEREKAAIGVLITLNPPTGPMREEAATAGFYTSPELGRVKYPRIQVLTVEELLNGRKVDCPPFAVNQGNVTFKRAPEGKFEDRSGTKASSIHEFQTTAEDSEEEDEPEW